MASRSTGGAPSPRKVSAGVVWIISTSSAARSTSGTSAMSQTRAVIGGAVAVSGVTARSHGLKQPHPAQLGELALMRVEHELARIAEPRLEDRALPLTQHD